MTILEKINLLVGGLSAVATGVIVLLGLFIRIAVLLRQLRHEMNSRLDEMKLDSHKIGKLEGAQEEREKSRLIAKDLLRETAEQANSLRPPVAHTDDLAP